MKMKIRIMNEPKVSMSLIETYLSQRDLSVKRDGNVLHVGPYFEIMHSHDKRLYSRLNFVGVNPFIFMSGIDLSFREFDAAETQLEIDVNSFRSTLFLGIILLVSVIGSFLLPSFGYRILFVISSGALGYLFIFQLCLKRLIKTELSKVASQKKDSVE